MEGLLAEGLNLERSREVLAFLLGPWQPSVTETFGLFSSQKWSRGCGKSVYCRLCLTCTGTIGWSWGIGAPEYYL